MISEPLHAFAHGPGLPGETALQAGASSRQVVIQSGRPGGSLRSSFASFFLENQMITLPRFRAALLSLLTATSLAHAQWSPTGLDGSYVRTMTAKGADLFAGTSGDGIFLSTNAGTTWTALNTGLTNTYVKAFAVSGTSLFAGTEGGGVFRSTDNGASWGAAGSLTDPYVYALAASGDTLFAGADGGGVFLSTNSGGTWTPASSGLTNTRVFALAVSGGHLYAGTFGGGVFRSTNNGTSWTPAGVGLTNTDVWCIAVSGPELFAGTGGGVFRSTDNGAHWTAASAGLTDAYVHALSCSGTHLFAGTDTAGVFHSSNGGTTWTGVSAGLSNATAWALAVLGPDLFAGTNGSGVWRRPLSEIITSAEIPSPNLPLDVRLERNYPNPFNPSTTIPFHLASKTMVSLRVFDALGREVTTLVSGELPPGTHSRQWNAAGAASGVYFYRLQAGSFAETKKLVLLR